MKRAIICATMIALSVSIADGADAGKKKRARSSPVYKLTAISSQMWSVIDINNKGEVLIDRQLEEFATAAPLILDRRNRESAAFQCPGTTNDTIAENFNNNSDIVGHCGHQPRFTVSAFVANPRSGGVELLSYPGAQSTWGFGVNDFRQVVGVVITPEFIVHGFIWDPATQSYQRVDHPLALPAGGGTHLTDINNKGQALGFRTTARNIPSEEFDFLYDNGSFTDIEFPGATFTQASALNNNTQILGIYSAPGCSQCVFLRDDDLYFAITLPLPANEPRPDGVDAGVARLIGVGGLNDKQQFVGNYVRVLEWALDRFGFMSPKRSENVRFIATPK